jgi:ribosomal protein L11 methyltransferase
VTRLPRHAERRYDLVCANLLTTLLIQERRLLAGLVQPGGLLVLAGILDREFSAVRSAYEEMDFRLLTSRREREWRSGLFAPGLEEGGVHDRRQVAG